MSNPPPNQQRRPDARKVDFFLKPKFTNNLPDIPFEGKFMNCPFIPLSRFCEYNVSSLEKEYKHTVLCDDDMGLNVDLIDIALYDEDKKQYPYDEKDTILLEDESTSKLNMKRSAQHSRVVPWMRKTEYISTEYNRQGVSSERQETKLGYHLKKGKQIDDLYRDRQSQIDAINKTFEDVKKPIKKHYDKKGVHAVEEFYLFPDFDQWKNLYAYIHFDAENVNREIPENLRRTAAEMSMIRGMQIEDESFAALYTPTMETLQKKMDDLQMGRDYDPDEKYEYGLSREYTWKLEASNKIMDNFVFHWKDGKVHYNEIESIVKMTRRRNMNLSKKSKLIVTHRDFNEDELSKMESRKTKLMEQHRKEESEQEEDDDEKDDEKEDDDKAEENGKSDSSESDSDSDSNGKKADAANESDSSSSDDNANDGNESSD